MVHTVDMTVFATQTHLSREVFGERAADSGIDSMYLLLEEVVHGGDIVAKTMQVAIQIIFCHIVVVILVTAGDTAFIARLQLPFLGQRMGVVQLEVEVVVVVVRLRVATIVVQKIGWSVGIELFLHTVSPAVTTAVGGVERKQLVRVVELVGEVETDAVVGVAVLVGVGLQVVHIAAIKQIVVGDIMLPHTIAPT